MSLVEEKHVPGKGLSDPGDDLELTVSAGKQTQSSVSVGCGGDHDRMLAAGLSERKQHQQQLGQTSAA